MFTRRADSLLLIFVLLCGQQVARAAEPSLPPLEVRFLKDGARVVLSRGDQLIAAAQVRPVSKDQAAPVLKGIAWRDAKALGENETGLRPVSVAQGQGRPPVSVLLRASRTKTGVRLLVSPSAGGIDEPGLEMAIQVFSADPETTPHLFAVDGPRPGVPTRDPPAVDGPPFRALRLTFQNKGDRRVEVARSGPALWSLSKLDAGCLLRHRLLPDPRRREHAGTFVMYLGDAWDGGAVDISPLHLNKRRTPSWDFIEGWARVYANGADPYAYKDLTVMWEVVLPDGRRRLQPCFFWEGPEDAPAEGEFRFRFAPPGPGVYGLRLRVILAGKETYTDAVAVEAGPPASKGFVQVRRGERVMRFSDGTVYLPVGLNLAWPPRKGDADWYRKTFRELVRNGADATRVWLCSWGMPLEPKAGRFDPTMAAALDGILLAAQARGVYVTLVAENAHDLAKEFEKHPYSRTMGGPLPAAVEFFKDQGSGRYFKRRLTYLAARYGAYRSVLGWELFNELDEAWPQLKVDPDDPRQMPIEADRARAARRDVTRWVSRMAQHLKSMDGGLHPVTVSTALSPDRRWSELDDLDDVDWLTPHGYIPEGAKARRDRDLDETCLLVGWSEGSRTVGHPHKPFWIGEFGYRAMHDKALKAMGTAAQATERNSRDAGGLLLHNSMMAGLASGQAGTPMHWWWDRYVALNSLWTLFRGPSLFAGALSRIATRDGPDMIRTLSNASEQTAAVRVLGRVGRSGMCLWLQDKRSNWTARLEREEGPLPEVKGLELRAPTLAAGTYSVVWLDVWKGEEIRKEYVRILEAGEGETTGPIELKAPAFQRDVAVLIEPKR